MYFILKNASFTNNIGKIDVESGTVTPPSGDTGGGSSGGGGTTTPGTGTSNGISYTYELGKSIQTSTGNVLEGDSYKHLTLVTLSSNNTQNLTMHLANGYSYKIFYYKNNSFVDVYNSDYEQIIYNNQASWLLINQPTLDYDTIKIIYKESTATSSTHTAVAPDDVELAFRNICVGNDYELGTSIQSTYGYLLYDNNSTYSHICILKPINYQDSLKFKINEGYVWAIYAFDSKMNYLGTHDGATSSPWEAATSNYAVSQVKTQWANVAYITAAYKATSGVGGENVDAPSVSGAAFY